VDDEGVGEGDGLTVDAEAANVEFEAAGGGGAGYFGCGGAEDGCCGGFWGGGIIRFVVGIAAEGTGFHHDFRTKRWQWDVLYGLLGRGQCNGNGWKWMNYCKINSL
jgi:hypothetical protein